MVGRLLDFEQLGGPADVLGQMLSQRRRVLLGGGTGLLFGFTTT